MGPASEAKVAQISHTVTLNRLLDMGPACQRHTPLFNILQTSPYNFIGTPFNQKHKRNQLHGFGLRKYMRRAAVRLAHVSRRRRGGAPSGSGERCLRRSKLWRLGTAAGAQPP